MIKNLKDKKVKIDEDTFIADSADVLGDVIIGKSSSVWHGAVVRGDISDINIGKYTNIQDNATVHVDTNQPTEIGDYVTIGHNSIVHGCKVGSNSLIGMGAIILNGAVIGENCIIGAGSLITENVIIPPNSLVIGSPGRVKRQTTDEEIETTKDNAIRYEKLWREEHI